MTARRRAGPRVRAGLLAGLALLAAALAAPARCESAPDRLDFLRAYELALQHDPTWQAARSRREADAEERALGRSGLLPNVGYRYWRSRNRSEVRETTLFGPSVRDVDYDGYASSLTLVQPLFDAAAYARYREGRARADAAEHVLERAHQALAVRTLQAYLDVLYAEDELALAEAHLQALTADAERVERFLRLGEGTVTERAEAQARRHLAEVARIESGDRRRDALNALRALIGGAVPQGGVAPLLSRGLPLEDGLEPLEAWRRRLLAGNPELAAQRSLVEAARRRHQRQRAGHLPSLDLLVRQQLSSSNAENQIGQRYDTGTIGIELSVPLYAGGGTSAASRQARALLDEAEHELEAATTDLLDDLERQYLRVRSGPAKIEAYQQALAAAEQRVAATRKSVLGGERTHLDVLDAEQARYQTQRDAARARYDFLLAWLSLRWQAGALGRADVQRIAACFGVPAAGAAHPAPIGPAVAGASP
ncbi:TolC family outer membrane protein [Luteimonas sp. Y-2-2-4F]|nr:TolC family outer membrane protein [Luteimonas sp. Y-2-2-4F]MCD9030773.1 TolC family outer membrane protein [Luteimonas sp. Y-2-2-4F]